MRATISTARTACPLRVTTGRVPRRRPVAAQAVAPDVAFAIQQQAVAFAVVVAAEGWYQRALIPAGAPGRPSPAVFGGGAAAAAAAAALVGGGGGGAGAGLALGAAASLVTLAAAVQRARAVRPASPGDWPGPWAWPVFTALASFAMCSAFVQALRG